MLRSILISFAALTLGGCGLIIGFEDHVVSEPLDAWSDANGPETE